MKRQISLILVLLFALAALPLGVLAAGNDYRYATEPVNMRTGPGTQYPKAGLARNGEKYVNANPDKWVPVLVDGEIRWISGKYAKAVETA